MGDPADGKLLGAVSVEVTSGRAKLTIAGPNRHAFESIVRRAGANYQDAAFSLVTGDTEYLGCHLDGEGAVTFVSFLRQQAR